MNAPGPFTAGVAFDIVRELAKLREGLDNGNSAAEFRVSQLAERAEKLVVALSGEVVA